jgi:4-hydroxy-3-methylbut-2-enyl diphosphate reductase
MSIQIILAKPRGFCAGVTRAIEIVEQALKKYGAPVYVRHEIVHNQYVVEQLRNAGAIFVKEIEDIPEGAVTVFSAHGVSSAVEEDAASKSLEVIDATCPLVKKVHNQAVRYEKSGHKVVLIGHDGHPEVEGTSGRLEKEVILVESVEDVAKIEISGGTKLSYVTQTTLSVDDTKDIIMALKQRFPEIEGPDVKDICYATQNRQDAVRELSKRIEVLLVIGAANSSNSNRLKDLGQSCGVRSYLITGANDIKRDWVEGVRSIGVTAGASAPEVLVEQVIQKLKEMFVGADVTTMDGLEENVYFKLPRGL